MSANPFMPTGGPIALDVSTCSVIAAGIAERLQNRGMTYDVDAVLDRIFLPEDPEVLLTAEQVGKLLAVSRDSMFDLARRQHDPMPSRKIGRSRRFVRAEVDAWSGRQV